MLETADTADELKAEVTLDYGLMPSVPYEKFKFSIHKRAAAFLAGSIAALSVHQVSKEIQMLSTLTQLEQWIDERVTDPLHPEYSLVFAQVEFWPGIRDGGDSKEYYFAVKNRPGSLGARLRDWVLKQFGPDTRLSHWETIPSSRQLRAESEYENEDEF